MGLLNWFSNLKKPSHIIGSEVTILYEDDFIDQFEKEFEPPFNGSDMLNILEKKGVDVKYRRGHRGLTIINCSDLEDLNNFLYEFGLCAEESPTTTRGGQIVHTINNQTKRVCINIKIKKCKNSKIAFKQKLEQATIKLYELGCISFIYFP